MRRHDREPSFPLAELDLGKLRELFGSNGDVTIHPYFDDAGEGRSNPYLIYCAGMIDDRRLNEFMYGQLRRLLTPSGDEPNEAAPIDSQHLERIVEPRAVAKMTEAVFSGDLVLFFPRNRVLCRFSMASPPQRTPSESSTEISIKGPRDGFTEDVTTNVALVRKRLKTTSLGIEYFELGERTMTTVALLYMTDITNGEILDEVRHRLNNIEADGVVSGQQLETGLADSSLSLFPLLEYMGRPDFAVESLLRGRFVLIVDGNPMAVIGPTNLTSLVKSPEDLHSPFYYTSLERILRMLGLLVAVLLPGFWVAVSAFNLDQIPFPLLATITVSRLGLPLSGPIDLFLMLGLFELFREAGMRLPKAVGQTVAVVGGLIVGDAAISAGLTGPTTLVISAVTAVSTFTLVNQSLSGSVTVIRFLVLIMCSLFGMLGFFVSLYLLVVYVSSLTSFGVPYMSPISPIRFKDVLKAIISLPWKLQNKRPSIYKPKDGTRTGKGK